jgi:hypothetical protein
MMSVVGENTPRNYKKWHGNNFKRRRRMSQKTTVKRLNLKEMIKDPKKKGFFRSHGLSRVKVTRLDSKGEAKEEYYDIEIYPLGDHPVLKEYRDKNPQPEPPKTSRLININTGRDFTQEGITIDEARQDPNYNWSTIYDYTDKKYKEAMEKRENEIQTLMIMICFDMVDDYGIDKIDEFEKALKELGLTANQLNKIGNDIKNLDFLPTKR